MATLLCWILETFFRPTGRHRAIVPVTTSPKRTEHPYLPRCERHVTFDGDAVALVRPYLVAHEKQCAEDQQQHERLRVLVRAAMGIDCMAEVTA